eukprot:TRINITY_DN90870_c0_g1_i1.p1 TRINITY_DN90870_c0_g1~~TRINITY_DN90870_c0_g1_i1.p1  ORF type:complete len:740 (-),score=171.15 TRINITY_DN90870_c0_g1_i1:84-2303(-)
MAPPPAAPPPPLRRSSVKATKALVNLPGSDSRDLGRKKQSKEPSDSCGGLSGTDSRPDSAHSAQREDTRRQESLRQALAKAEAAKAAAAQRQQDLRVGEMWNAVFKVSANRNDPEKLAEFWEVVKNRLLQRFGSLQDAVKGVQNPGDGSVTFPKFCDLLRLVHLPLHQSSCRAMFDKAAGGAREMPGDALKALLMDRTIRAMRFVMEGWNCKQARVKMHIRAFLKGLAETNEDMANRAIDRFQRKLTAAFFASFWQLLLSKLGGSPAEEGTLSQRSESITLSLSSLLRIMQDQEVRSRFLPNEMLYVLRIYECISSFRQSLGAPPAGISVGHFITGLVLLSPMMEREDKIAFIFQAFDNDYDGCVIYKQIHDMCRCICVLKRMAEPCFAEGSRNSSAEEEPFQAELTTQEGQRAYECIRWHLQRSGNVQGEIVSLPEFTSALKMQPSVFRALLPGTTRIRWALQAREGEDLEEQLAAAEEEAVGEANSKRAVSKNVTSPPPSVRAASKGPVAAWAASSPATGGRTPSRSTTGVRREREAFSDQQPNDFLAFERASPDRIGPRPAHLKNSKSESLFFKSHISTKFTKSLRGRGDRRLAELTNSFLPAELQLEDLTVQAEEQKAKSRPSSAASTSSKAGMSRTSSAPTLRTKGERKSQLAMSAAELYAGGRGDLPVLGFRPQRWGNEASDRFKVYAAAKTGEDHNQVTMRRKRPDPGQSADYKCVVCHRTHTLCPGHDSIS